MAIFLNGPFTASFCLFSSFTHYNFNNTNWKKLRRFAWDLNLWLQDGRHRRNHWAMTATTFFVLQVFFLALYLALELFADFYKLFRQKTFIFTGDWPKGSVTRLGDFWHIKVTYFFTYSCPNIDFWATLKNFPFM